MGLFKKKKNSKEFNKKFKKRFLTRKSGVILFFTAIILIIVMFGCIQSSRKERQLQATIDEYRRENQKIREQNDAIEEDKDRIQDMNRAMDNNMTDEETDESIRSIARNILGMINEDEYYLQESENSN